MAKQDIGSYILVEKSHLFEIIEGCSNYASNEDRTCGDCEFDTPCQETWERAMKVSKQIRLEKERGIRDE